MITNCPVCGKAFEVLWPQSYRYKRDGRYLCSYTCMRAKDRKDNEEMNTFTKEQKAKAVQIAMDGGDPKAFLKECGSKNPENLWYYIKNVLKKNDPETYQKLMKPAAQKQVETPEGEFAKAPVLKVDGAVRIETPEKNKVEVVETPEGPVKGPVTPDELYEKITSFHTVKNVSAVEGDTPERFCRYTAIDTPIGEFHYDRRHGYLDWDWDNNTMSLNTEEWKEFMKWFPYALEQLGVKL